MVCSGSARITRRDVLRMAALGVAGLTAGFTFRPSHAEERGHFNFVENANDPTKLEYEHIINIRLPIIAEDGANVPMVISLNNHPMETDHYVKSIQIVSFNDPIVGKGLYEFSPANGIAYIANQMRMDGGDTEVVVIAECTRHGKWVAREDVKVSLGGC